MSQIKLPCWHWFSCKFGLTSLQMNLTWRSRASMETGTWTARMCSWRAVLTLTRPSPSTSGSCECRWTPTKTGSEAQTARALVFLWNFYEKNPKDMYRMALFFFVVFFRFSFWLICLHFVCLYQDNRLMRLEAKHSSSTAPCVPDGQMLRYKYRGVFWSLRASMQVEG